MNSSVMFDAVSRLHHISDGCSVCVWRVRDITWGSLSNFMQLPPELQKALCNFSSHTCSSSPLIRNVHVHSMSLCFAFVSYACTCVDVTCPKYRDFYVRPKFCLYFLLFTFFGVILSRLSSWLSLFLLFSVTAQLFLLTCSGTMIPKKLGLFFVLFWMSKLPHSVQGCISAQATPRQHTLPKCSP